MTGEFIIGFALGLGFGAVLMGLWIKKKWKEQ